MPAQRVPRPLLALAASAAFLALPAAASAADCPGQDFEPTPQNMAQVEAATLCLMNAERTARRLPALGASPQLRTAALRHSADMVEQRYFSHDSLDGRDFTDRIDATGWIPRRGRWHIGENIGWGSGELASPLRMMQGWMNSPAHRDNLLDRDFREVGIGIAAGAPATTSFPGATYTTDFGSRPDRARTARKAKSKRTKARRGRKSRRRTRSRGTRRTRIVATLGDVQVHR